METKYDFTLLSLQEFEQWILQTKIARTILKVQQHHTYSPSYKDFNGKNHFERQKSMQSYHIKNNGWNDIGQHFTIFPDGTIMTGRSLEKTPACIYAQNANSVCIENLGNFDKNDDTILPAQAKSIVRVTALLCQKFNLPIDTNSIVYHHWFNLSTGARNNGSGGNKSCPGTAFFGGNKVADCEKNFLPLVKKEITAAAPFSNNNNLRYAFLKVDSSVVRTGPSGTSSISPIQKNVFLGAILRVYQEDNGWYKISQTANMWVNAKHTQIIRKGKVISSSLNVRAGAGTQFPSIDALKKDEFVFIEQSEKNWSKIASEDKWVNHSYIEFEK